MTARKDVADASTFDDTSVWVFCSHDDAAVTAPGPVHDAVATTGTSATTLRGGSVDAMEPDVTADDVVLKLTSPPADDTVLAAAAAASRDDDVASTVSAALTVAVDVVEVLQFSRMTLTILHCTSSVDGSCSSARSRLADAAADSASSLGLFGLSARPARLLRAGCLCCCCC